MITSKRQISQGKKVSSLIYTKKKDTFPSKYNKIKLQFYKGHCRKMSPLKFLTNTLYIVIGFDIGDMKKKKYP